MANTETKILKTNLATQTQKHRKEGFFFIPIKYMMYLMYTHMNEDTQASQGETLPHQQHNSQNLKLHHK